MIRLFSSTDKVFTSNGDVVLNPTKAIVHKEDNGDYYLDIEMGLEYVDYIVEGNIIVAPTPTGDQAFRIGNVTKKKSKISTRCYHVFYDSENYLIVDSYVVNKTCAEALAHLNNATEPVSEFTTSSDVSHVDSFRCVRKSLYEAVQTVLERWGGHLVRDNFGIQIKSSIGHDNGIIVQYKKNLKDITCSENWNNVVTKILPVGRDGIMLNELDPTADIYITSSTQYDLPYTKTVSFNQTLNEEDYPSEQAFKEALVADLRAQATSYLATNCVPQVNYTLKANLEKLTDVGDVVEVIDERLGVHLMTSVIAFDYDCIFGKYTDIQFGNFPQTIAGLANRIATTTENYINGKGYTATSWNQIQSTGTKIAEVVIDGRTYDVYAPAGGSSDVSWNQTQGSGDKIAEVTIDGTTQNVYAPNSQTFSEASTRANIDSGETYPTIFGKIKKFFADLKAVAFSGSYSDLSGKPTKLSDFTNDVVNNATLTIQKNGTNVQTFTANASSNATANITVPTKTSDLTNDSGYVTSTDLNGKVSKTGDTMTGDLELQGADIILDSTNSGGNILQRQTSDPSYVYTNALPAQDGTLATTSDVNGKVSKTGDTMTGNLNLQGTPSSITELWMSVNNSGMLYGNILEPQSSVTTALAINTLPSSSGTLALTSQIPDISTKVSKSGDTMTGSLEITGADIILDASNGSGNMLQRQTSDQSYCYTNTLPAQDGTLALKSDMEPIVHNNSDIPEGATNLSNTATAHRVTAYRNGFSIPYQMNDTNDGGILRVRGTSESNCILELGTWDDSGAGETIQFNYYPTTSQVTPTHSVTVPKKSGTIALISDIPTNNNQLTNGAGYITSAGSCNYASSAGSATNDASGNNIEYKYVNIYNYDNWGQSGSVTFNDLATQGMSMAMINPATDNPTGAGKWCHAISMAWVKGSNSNWVSQIAINVQDGYGMWYRTNQGAITGRGWNQVIDSGNIGSQSVNYANSAGSASSASYATQASYLGDVYSSDRNSANGNGWYSTGTAQTIPSGYSLNPMAINYYWGVDVRTGNNGWFKINGNEVLSGAGGVVSGTNAIEFGDNTVYIHKDGNSWLEMRSVNGNRYRANYHDFVNPDNNAWVSISAGGFVNQSSKRFKENIENITDEDALKILDVRVVKYDYKEGMRDNDRQRFGQHGVIAEEIDEIIPEVVFYGKLDPNNAESEEVPTSVDYSKFVPFLIKMVQIQQKEIDELKELIKNK